MRDSLVISAHVKVVSFKPFLTPIKNIYWKRKRDFAGFVPFLAYEYPNIERVYKTKL